MSDDAVFLLMMGMILAFALGMLALVKRSERAERRGEQPQ